MSYKSYDEIDKDTPIDSIVAHNIIHDIGDIGDGKWFTSQNKTIVNMLIKYIVDNIGTLSQNQNIIDAVSVSEYKKLGSGASNTVYKINEDDLIIRVSSPRCFSHGDVLDLYMNDNESEVVYTNVASMSGFGAVIYDFFMLKKKVNTTICFVQVYIGKSYTGDVEQTLYDCNNPNPVTVLCESMMAIQNYILFEFGLLCSDVKPGNYVVDYTDINKIDPKNVKMIDFGADMCLMYVLNPDTKKKAPIYYILVTILLFITSLIPMGNEPQRTKTIVDFYSIYLKTIMDAKIVKNLKNFIKTDGYSCEIKFKRNIIHYGKMVWSSNNNTSLTIDDVFTEIKTMVTDFYNTQSINPSPKPKHAQSYFGKTLVVSGQNNNEIKRKNNPVKPTLVKVDTKKANGIIKKVIENKYTFAKYEMTLDKFEDIVTDAKIELKKY